MNMVETQDGAGSAEQGLQHVTRCRHDFMEKFGSVSLDSKENLSSKANNYGNHDMLASHTASQTLWSTGILSEPIPDGFYSAVPEKRLTELFDDIPTLDELYSLGYEGLNSDIIMVDSEKDKKLSMLKQLIVALVKGLNSNPAAMIKKIATLVSDFYKRPNLELSPTKDALEESSHTTGSRGVQMLGQIKHGSCRPRAILFKVLADTVGLESKLMVGLPSERGIEFIDSYKHMSVIVVLNSTELLVDLMRFPGHLIPPSTKAIYMTHIFAAGESDSAENDSCDSPLEPNSPMYGFSERVDPESVEKDEGLQSQRRLASNIGSSLRNMMLRSSSSIDRKLSLSHSEPNIATSFWRRSRKKVIAEHRTASSSPEHPSFRARARSMLSGERNSFRDYNDDLAASSCRSEGASTSEPRRCRRRSISITPEIGDDIVRAVRAMNETLKQNRLSSEQGDNKLSTYSKDGDSGSGHQKNEYGFDQNDGDEISRGRSDLYNRSREKFNFSKAMSLPSSPHAFMSQNSEQGGSSDYKTGDDTVVTWNKVLDSPLFHDKPLLPFQGWNIDYQEVTVGTRVGIGFFGEVFRGVWNGTEVAIKVFLEQDLTAENMEDFCNEISILRYMTYPQSPPISMISNPRGIVVVILFLGACTKPPHLSMVTEYMEMGSLYYLIHLSGQKKKISWRKRLKMCRDICRGLMCIHRMKIVHRDLKSANCLVNKHWTVKICDFGLSRIMTETPLRDSSSAGTPEWMAPELIRNEPFTEKCDIFSLGVIMWELCTLRRPWEGVPPQKVVYVVANEGSRLEIPQGPLGSLIADCWAEPSKRPSCEEILTRLVDCEYSLC